MFPEVMRMILNQFLGRLSAIALLAAAGLGVQSPVLAITPPPVASQAPESIPTEAKAAFARSAKQLKQAEYQPALATLDQVVRRYPQLAAAYLERGKFYRAMAENIGAIDMLPSVVDSYALENFNRAIALQPNQVDGYAERASFWMSRRDFGRALRDADRAIQLDPMDQISAYRLYVLRAGARTATDDFAGAKADYDRAMQAGDYRGELDRGRMSLLLGDTASAIRDFDVVIQRSGTPKGETAPSWRSSEFHHRGLAKAMAQDYVGAIADLDQSVKLAGQDHANLPDYYRDRGLVRWLQGQPKAALADFDQSLKGLNPGGFGSESRPVAHYLRAALWTELGNPSKAQADLEALAQESAISFLETFEDPSLRRVQLGLLQPILAKPVGADPIAAQFARAKVQLALGDRAASVRSTDAAVRLAPNQAGLYQMRLELFAAGREPAANIADLNQLIRLQPDQLRWLTDRAESEIARGNFRAAIADYDRVIQRAAAADAYTDRGEARLAMGDLKGAIADFDQAIAQVVPADRKSAAHIRPYVSRAEAYERLGQYNLALSDLQAAVQMRLAEDQLSPLPLGYLRLRFAKVRLAMGDAKGAIADLQKSQQEALVDQYLTQNQIGLAQLKLGDRAGAMIAFEQALYANAAPDRASAWYERGVAQRYLGDRAAAIAAYRESARLYQQAGQVWLGQRVLAELKTF